MSVAANIAVGLEAAKGVLEIWQIIKLLQSDEEITEEMVDAAFDATAQHGQNLIEQIREDFPTNEGD